MAKDENRQSLVDYKLDDYNRQSLRKSLLQKDQINELWMKVKIGCISLQ